MGLHYHSDADEMKLSSLQLSDGLLGALKVAQAAIFFYRVIRIIGHMIVVQ